MAIIIFLLLIIIIIKCLALFSKSFVFTFDKNKGMVEVSTTP